MNHERSEMTFRGLANMLLRLMIFTVSNHFTRIIKGFWNLWPFQLFFPFLVTSLLVTSLTSLLVTSLLCLVTPQSCSFRLTNEADARLKDEHPLAAFHRSIVTRALSAKFFQTWLSLRKRTTPLARAMNTHLQVNYHLEVNHHRTS